MSKVRLLAAVALLASGLAAHAAYISGHDCTGATTTSAGYTSTRVVNVSNITQLNNAVSNLQAGDTIVLANGTYTLTGSLFIQQPNVTLMGNGPGCGGAIIQGGGQDNASGPAHAIWTDAANINIAQLTLRDTYDNLVVCNAGCSALHIYNTKLINSGSQFVKINGSNTAKIGGVVVEYSRFEYTADAPNDHGSGLGYGYFNGISAHGTSGMVVRDNTFYRLRVSDACTDACQNPSVLIWNGSVNPVVERNLFIEVDQAISFGLVQRGSYTDCSGGIARNNVIYNPAGFWSAGRQANGSNDGLIRTFEGPNSKVYNNTVISNSSMGYCVANRFSTSTGVVIRNNLCDKAINSTDLGASATVSNNVTSATSGMFVAFVDANLHLVSGASGAIDQGFNLLADVPDDFDKASRSAPLDIGAYLFGLLPGPANFRRVPQ